MGTGGQNIVGRRFGCAQRRLRLAIRKRVRCVLIVAAVLTVSAAAEPSPGLKERDKSGDQRSDVRGQVASATGGPPVARVEIVKDTYFGETVEDPYRWMENDKDPGWLPFLKAENDYTRKVLDKLPG